MSRCRVCECKGTTGAFHGLGANLLPYFLQYASKLTSAPASAILTEHWAGATSLRAMFQGATNLAGLCRAFRPKEVWISFLKYVRTFYCVLVQVVRLASASAPPHVLSNSWAEEPRPAQRVSVLVVVPPPSSTGLSRLFSILVVLRLRVSRRAIRISMAESSSHGRRARVRASASLLFLLYFQKY